MTREEARKAAEVMMAYADGKDIEFCRDGENWDLCVGYDDDDLLGFDFSRVDYRIKKEPTYRPFKNKEECWNEMQKHQPFGWLKHKNEGYLSYFSYLCDVTDFISFYENLTFVDGTPFGIKEE